MSTEVDVRIQNDGHAVDSACAADYHQHCACPATCECPCHPKRDECCNTAARCGKWNCDKCGREWT